ncbi:chemotaxis protein CheW [Maridesulfovibrio sp.]|uniref:chemotaxis protein CheW n=1 Tax=Maridesulfovibrio sp. TaxID=2795000 RepID=UPI002A18BECE|nr:chemotaxis protein CheW [Maridesulfovibrio sp.]
MLVLTFRIGNYLYGLEAVSVVEVVPPTICKELPRSPKFVKGLFNYRGKVTPVVDLSMLATDRSCRPLMSTRIIIVDLADLDPEAGRGEKFLGLLAESITETLKVADKDFETSGLEIPDAPWLGKVARVNGVMLQLIRPDRLLTPELHKILFPHEEPSGVSG